MKSFILITISLLLMLPAQAQKLREPITTNVVDGQPVVPQPEPFKKVHPYLYWTGRTMYVILDLTTKGALAYRSIRGGGF